MFAALWGDLLEEMDIQNFWPCDGIDETRIDGNRALGGAQLVR